MNLKSFWLIPGSMFVAYWSATEIWHGLESGALALPRARGHGHHHIVRLAAEPGWFWVGMVLWAAIGLAAIGALLLVLGEEDAPVRRGLKLFFEVDEPPERIGALGLAIMAVFSLFAAFVWFNH